MRHLGESTERHVVVMQILLVLGLGEFFCLAETGRQCRASEHEHIPDPSLGFRV
jgi:hypothetical protein